MIAEVLLVEDDPGDVLMTREALGDDRADDRLVIRNRLHVVSDGLEALQWLRKESPFEQTPMADLILLDLNLPRVNGREVLAQIKSDESLRRIPVVVLTTSESEQDVLNSYGLHANAYVTKPVDFDSFIEVVRKIDDFFLGVARLPTH